MHAKPAPSKDIRRIDLALPSLVGLHAVHLLAWAQETGGDGLIYVADGERRAEHMAQILKGLDPDLEVHVLPAWDCLPYDSASPSREIMGQRMSVLRSLSRPGNAPRVLIASPASLLQRVPPRVALKGTSFTLRTREPFSQAELESYLRRAGYMLDERVDEPGEAAIRGQVIDLFPANSSLPFRAEHDGEVILAIRAYDPVSQRTEAEFESLLLEPASEIVFDEDKDGNIPERSAGMEHRLPEFHMHLETVFDYCPDAVVIMDAAAEERRRIVLEQVSDAYESRTKLRMVSAGGHALSPERLFIGDDEWHELLARHRLTIIRTSSLPETRECSVPHFASTKEPARALAEFIDAQREEGRKIVFAAATGRDLSRIRRRVRPSAELERVAGWRDVLAGPAGAWFVLQADLKGGFVDRENGIALVTATDVLGSRASSGPVQISSAAAMPLMEAGFHIGDAVIHVEHGVGILEGIETVFLGGTERGDAIRLGYAGDASLVIPANEMEHVWRYGAAAEALSLDRLNGDAWPARRQKIEADLRETAKRLNELVKARESVRLDLLVPLAHEYERFVARFPFLETPDQSRAIEEVLSDLASGRPMDRLVCGDVGYGKTEVALRAAAVAALAGKQVAIVAPTTVLARQHLRIFQRRFAGFGIEVAHLSRLVKPAEARAVKKGLTDGTIRIVVGTHALAGKGVTFKDLGLVVIDEEQRFGVAHKAKLRALASGGHVLTLTATPIPRTLQAALVGLQDLSTIATPPARRQPIRTFLTPFDPATIREALMRERRRSGQSFVVCSRVEDIEPMREKLAKLVPELEIIMAHGQMPPAETDEAMVRFADGEGDVLLATNIIESGLDVPRANTMLVWRADRFGLAQLHQLRGRVGRGRIRGTTYLVTEVGQVMPKATEKRLRTLEALDRLGAGFAISAQDLDLRGAGALLGEEQAGHIKLIGADLYQFMLRRALRGEALEDDWTPDLNIGLNGIIPDDYVNEPEVRINLHARLARLDEGETVDDLAAEIEDRFGSAPEPVQHLLELANLKRLCRRLGIARIDAGPQAIALTFRPGAAEGLPLKALIKASPGELKWSGGRLVFTKSSEQAEERQKLTLELLDRLLP